MVSIADCLEQITTALQLLGQLDNVGPPPASSETIQGLPTVKITKKNVGEYNLL